MASHTRFEKIVQWIHAIKPIWRSSVATGLQVIWFGLAIKLRDAAKDVSDWSLVSTAILFALIFGVLVYIYLSTVDRLNSHLADQVYALERARERVVEIVHGDADVRELADNIRDGAVSSPELMGVDGVVGEGSSGEFTRRLICSLQRIDRYIHGLYQVVSDQHSRGYTPVNRPKFEVTLILRSIIDGKLTIAAWANRDGLKPKTLEVRKGSPDVLDASIAADMLSSGDVETRVIPDTSDASAGYRDLYGKQRKRIRSSVLHPILSGRPIPRAVVVLHCDHTGFFREEDRAYWSELFREFALPIGLELDKIEIHNKLAAQVNAVVLSKYEPF